MHMLMHLGALAVAILVLARALPGVKVKNPLTAVLVAVVFSVLNFTLGWLVAALLIVPTLLSLGLFLFFVPFIVNTVMLWGTDKVLKDFEITDLSSLLVSSGAITVLNFVLHRAL